jgi:hypothetical protein
MSRASAIALLLLLVLHGRAAAEERAMLDRLGLRGSLAATYFSSDHDLDDKDNFPGLNFVLQQRLRLPAGIRWVAEGRLLAQHVTHDDTSGTGWSSRGFRYTGDVTAELREGCLEITREDWGLRLGRQLIAWGRADELNPTDVISPKDYLLLLPDAPPGYRFGVTSVKADYFLPHSLRLSGVWVPVFAASVIPLSDPPPGIRLREDLPPITVRNGSAGIKLDRSGEDIDASLSYFYGFNLLPEFHVTGAAADPTSGATHATVEQRHPRQHMVGADFATTYGRLGYRGEVAFVDPGNENGHDVESIVPYLYYVLGVERTFFDNLSVILQYVGRWVPDRIDPKRALADADPLRGQLTYAAARETFLVNQQLDTVQNGWSARIGKRFWNDTLDCELLSVHYIERNDFFIRPKIAYAVTDAWTLTTGGEVFGGPEHSFFGRIKKNTGAFTELRYSF